jgi:hypothetical protein
LNNHSFQAGLHWPAFFIVLSGQATIGQVILAIQPFCHEPFFPIVATLSFYCFSDTAKGQHCPGTPGILSRA